MKTRQAIGKTVLLALFTVLFACSSPSQPAPTLTHIPPTLTPEPTSTNTSLPPSETPTSTPLACLSQPGQVEERLLESTDPPQAYFIYLPPCYDEKTDQRYPVLYLLHGQTYTADQWIRLGAVESIDKLILSGEARPFIVVFPDDHYWYSPAGTTFGQRLVGDLIPYIDSTYRTLPNRDYRAIGGMSRGAGWSLQLGLTRPDLFSVLGLHSLAVFQNDGTRIEGWLDAIPPGSHLSIFMDIGEDDQELKKARAVEAKLTEAGFPHEWHLYQGAHTEEYWGEHVEEYLRWYAEQWNISP
jgi:enterochelin esterase-like enzyme